MQNETIKYVFDKGWRTLLMDMKVREVDVLVKAGLPRDLLTRRSPTVTAAEYFQFWHALEFVMRDEPAFPLRLMQTVAVESLGPPMFACFSCANLNVALSRVAHYKPLVGPLKLDVTQTESYTTVAFCGLDTLTSVPYSLIATELMFWVHISRLATRETIQPHAVFTTVDLPGRSAYEDFFGKPVQRRSVHGQDKLLRKCVQPSRSICRADEALSGGTLDKVFVSLRPETMAQLLAHPANHILRQYPRQNKAQIKWAISVK